MDGFQLIGDIAMEDGGKLHPHRDASHTGLVMLTSLGASCEFLVDLATGPKQCQLQQYGRCWCSDGKHWINKKVYEKQRYLRNKWQDRSPVSCPKELCCKQACPTCQVVQMESGDVLIFDAVAVVHGLTHLRVNWTLWFVLSLTCCVHAGLQRVQQTPPIPNM